MYINITKFLTTPLFISVQFSYNLFVSFWYEDNAGVPNSFEQIQISISYHLASAQRTFNMSCSESLQEINFLSFSVCSSLFIAFVFEEIFLLHIKIQAENFFLSVRQITVFWLVLFLRKSTAVIFIFAPLYLTSMPPLPSGCF